MAKLENVFPKEKMTTEQQLKSNYSKFGFLFLVVAISIFKIGDFFIYDYGYPVVKETKQIISTEFGKSDTIICKINGIYPIPPNKITHKIFLGISNSETFMFPRLQNNIDVIMLLILLFVFHLFVKSIILNGTFHNKTTHWVKVGALLSLYFFIFQSIFPYVIKLCFDINLSNVFKFDREIFSGFGWLFTSFFIKLLYSIFHMGNKLQEEQNLTI